MGALSALKYLNLYINQISNFNVDWTGLRSLTSLDLSFNGLVDSSLPEDFFLPSLTVLPLCGNKLTTIPAPILKLSTLRNLDLRFNRLESIPDDLGELSLTLRCLKLSNNCLHALPSSMSQLVALEELDLSSNYLESLENVQGLLKLTSLHAYWNGTTHLPENFGDLVELRELYLTENCIKSLPESMSRMVNLRNFMAHYNDLSTVPSGLSGLVDLCTLNLAENDITSIPPEISTLSTLTRLDLRANILATLPSTLSELRALNFLEMGDNNLLTIPPVIFDIPMLTSLNLFSNGISMVPGAIASLPLTSLNLSFNQLVTLPAELANMTSLVYLRLEGNFLKAFPEEIVSLLSLKELAIGSNRGIKELPPSISGLTRLATLQASSNSITYLPDTFVQLKALTELDISHNRLAALPADLDRLGTLTDLDISGNALTRIPPCFGNMRNLQQVKASFNPGLVDVPSEYLKAPTTWISCTGNTKIEGEYYFARKKEAEKTNWLLTEDDDPVPVEPVAAVHLDQITSLSSSTPLTSSTTETTEEDATPKDPLLTTIAEEEDDSVDTHFVDTNQIPAIIGQPSASPNNEAVLEHSSSTKSNKGPPADLHVNTHAHKITNSESDSTPATPTSSTPIFTAPIAVPTPASPEKTEKHKKKDKSKDKGVKSPKMTPHSSVFAVHDFHTPSALDDRRLTILPEDERDRAEWGSGIERSGTPGTPGTPESSSSPPISASPISGSPYLTTFNSKKEKKKDKEKEKEERKREKDVLASSGTSVGSTGSNSSGHGGHPLVENLVLRSPQVGWAEMRGGRPDMQDSLVIMEHFQGIPEATLIGLFDGHGGADTALLTAKKLPTLMRDTLRTLCDERHLDWSLQSLVSLSNADLALAIRASFMALHGAVAKAGFTDGTAATIAMVFHPFGTTPRTPTPNHPTPHTFPNLNVIHGDEVYHDTNVASWCEKGRATHILLNPPTSATAAQLAAASPPSTPTLNTANNNTTDSEDGVSPPSRPDTPLRSSTEGSSQPPSGKSKKDKSKHKTGDHKSFSVPLSSLFSFSGNSHHSPHVHSPSSNHQARSTSLLVIGNCGDQRAVICRRGQAHPLTKDHKPESDSEMNRINLSGGFVAESRRVNGLLALSRAIGDISVQPHVTFEPDIMVVELTEHDEFVILACDGVWDVLSNEQAVFLVQAETSPSRAANRIREYAYSLGSTDNISVIVYQLKPRERTNYGTCLMTHISESIAVQAASPRSYAGTGPLSGHLPHFATSSYSNAASSSSTQSTLLSNAAVVGSSSSHSASAPPSSGPLSSSAPSYPNPTHGIAPGTKSNTISVQSPKDSHHKKTHQKTPSNEPASNESSPHSTATTNASTSDAVIAADPDMDVPARKPRSASSSPAPSSPSSANNNAASPIAATPPSPSSLSPTSQSNTSPASSPKPPTFAELANSPGSKRRKKAKSNIDLTSAIDREHSSPSTPHSGHGKKERRRSTEKDRTGDSPKERRRSGEKEKEKDRGSKGSLQRSKDSKARDLMEKEAREAK